MTERNLTLAVFGLLAGCFAIAVGLLVAQKAFQSPFASPMFVGLGTQMLVMGTLNALPGRMRRARTVLRVLVISLALAVIPLAIAVIVAEFR